MSEQPEQDAPNWLSELEKKREIRLKARLGHEAGAGAPCIKCEEKCPGLDLHFWRKICKNCKCSKEDHDVHDDDIYGWAQFQLLGSKPSRIKKKIVLPGKKDEVELEWAPKGNTETIDQYLKTLAPESLPVKGSQAAQERKQLLQKQIPIHDLDPSLCHELTDSELAKMHDYIKHMKSSAGVGQIIQFGVNYGTLHINDPHNAQIIANRYNKSVPSIEPVQMQTSAMTKQLSKLGIQDQKQLDAFFDKIPNPQNMTAVSENLGYNRAENLGYGKPDSYKYNKLPTYQDESHNLGKLDPKFSQPLQKPNYAHNLPLSSAQKAAQFARENLGAEFPLCLSCENANQSVYPRECTNPGCANSRGAEQDSTNHNFNNNKSLKGLRPNQLRISEDELLPSSVKIGAIRDISYEQPEIKSAIQGENAMFEGMERGGKVPEDVKIETKQCKKCGKFFKMEEFAIFVEKSNALYHSDCFKCTGCNQNLADLFYFYDKESDAIYCGRDFAKIRGIPRCQACDELIFVKEYCLAENSTFHLKHFCCFECDQALAGQNYVLEDSQTVCLPCFEKTKANKCLSCARVIGPDEQGVSLNENIHFHAADECFCCFICKKVLHGAKLLFRNNKLYCSHDCFRSDQ